MRKVTPPPKYNEKIYKLGDILLILCPVSLILSLITTIMIHLITGLPFRQCTWDCFCYAVIPLSSLILGVVSRLKGYGRLKNIVVGLIFLVLQAILGAVGYESMTMN